MPLKWSIYLLRHPRTQEIRYIGFTSRNVEARLRQHIQVAVTKEQRNHRDNWLMSLVSIGLRPTIEILQNGSGAGWQEAEKDWIRVYRSQGARLVNSTDGGEGVIGWGTPEQRSERAKKRAANMTPEKRSAIARKIVAASSPEQRSNSAKARWAKKTPAERTVIAKRSWAKLTTKQIKLIRQKSREGFANLAKEELSNAMKAAWNRKTDQEREQYSLICSERNKKIWAAMTPEQRNQRREQLAKSLRKVLRKRWDSMTPEERSSHGRRLQQIQMSKKKGANSNAA